MIVKFYKIDVMEKQIKKLATLSNTFKNSSKQRMMLTGVLAGVAIGGVIALIISSNKNHHLKGKVNDWFCDLLESSKDKMNPIASLVKDSLSKINT